MGQTDRYAIVDDGRRLATGGPLNVEHYGPAWQIRVSTPINGDCRADDAVIVPDPGDGSARSLALKILDLLNSDRQPVAKLD